MSEKMKHTAGPWWVDFKNYNNQDEDHDDKLCSIRGGEDEWYIAEIVSDAGCDSNINARLIAASPSLLQSVNELIEQWCDLVNSGDAGNWDPETDEPIINARKAIAKATGAE